MKKWLITLIILCLWVPFQLGGTAAKKPRIGMMRFSVDVFDDQGKVVEGLRKKIEGDLKSAIKKKFGAAPYLKDAQIITYDDAEAPAVTLNPVIKPETIQKLEKLCTDKGLNAVVFGHFQEEDKLIVKFRYYLAKSQTITSLKAIYGDVEKLKKESSRKALVKSVGGLKKKLIKELDTHFNPPKPKPKPKKTTPQTKPGKKKVKKPSVIKPSEYKPAETLTAHQMYKMIIENGFYCAVLRGSSWQKGAISTLENEDARLKGKNLLKNGRKLSITTTNSDKDIIESESTHITKKSNAKIKLSWYLENSVCTFQQALSTIARRNKEDKKRTWRIPTIRELFSIVDDNDGNRFPVNFKLPTKKSFAIWTSSRLDTSTSGLNHIQKKIHLVIESSYDRSRKRYGQLRFAFREVEKSSNDKAYLLLVHSDKIYTANTIVRSNTVSDDGKALGFDTPVAKKKSPSKKTAGKSKKTPENGKIPGFGDNPPVVGIDTPIITPSTAKAPPKTTPPTGKTKGPDKIPGFDDVITPQKKPQSTQNKRYLPGPKTSGFDDTAPRRPKVNLAKKNPGTIRIALFPYSWVGEMDAQSIEFKRLSDINNKIKGKLKEILRTQKNKHRYQGLKLEVIKMAPEESDHVSYITRFRSIIDFSSPTEILEDQAAEVFEKIMIPKKIDIIVTVIPLKGENNEMGAFTPYILDGLNNKVRPLHRCVFNFRNASYVCITSSVKKAIENSLLKYHFPNDPVF